MPGLSWRDDVGSGNGPAAYRNNGPVDRRRRLPPLNGARVGDHTLLVGGTPGKGGEAANSTARSSICVIS